MDSEEKDVTLAARQLLESELAGRLAVVEKLTADQHEEDDLIRRLGVVQQRLAASYTEAERLGWSPQQLKKLGIRPPVRQPRGRPRSRTGERAKGVDQNDSGSTSEQTATTPSMPSASS